MQEEEFTAEGESLGYISLDQARIQPIEHASDNTESMVANTLAST